MNGKKLLSLVGNRMLAIVAIRCPSIYEGTILQPLTALEQTDYAYIYKLKTAVAIAVATDGPFTYISNTAVAIAIATDCLFMYIYQILLQPLQLLQTVSSCRYIKSCCSHCNSYALFHLYTCETQWQPLQQVWTLPTYTYIK